MVWEETGDSPPSWRQQLQRGRRPTSGAGANGFLPRTLQSIPLKSRRWYIFSRDACSWKLNWIGGPKPIEGNDASLGQNLFHKRGEQWSKHLREKVVWKFHVLRTFYRRWWWWCRGVNRNISTMVVSAEHSCELFTADFTWRHVFCLLDVLQFLELVRKSTKRYRQWRTELSCTYLGYGLSFLLLCLLYIHSMVASACVCVR